MLRSINFLLFDAKDVALAMMSSRDVVTLVAKMLSTTLIFVYLWLHVHLVGTDWLVRVLFAGLGLFFATDADARLLIM